MVEPPLSTLTAHDKVHDWCPAFAVVDIVSKAGCVDDGQLDLELLLLEFRFDDVFF